MGKEGLQSTTKAKMVPPTKITFHRVTAFGQGPSQVIIDGNTYHTLHNLLKWGATQARKKLIGDAAFEGLLNIQKEGAVCTLSEGAPIVNDNALQPCGERFPLAATVPPSEQCRESIVLLKATDIPSPEKTQAIKATEAVSDTASTSSQKSVKPVVRRNVSLLPMLREPTPQPALYASSEAYREKFQPNKTEFLQERFQATFSTIYTSRPEAHRTINHMQQDIERMQKELMAALRNMESRILSNILQMHTDLGNRILEVSAAIASLEGNTHLPEHQRQQVRENSVMSGVNRGEDDNYGSEDSSVISTAHHLIPKSPSSMARDIKQDVKESIE